MPAAVGRRDAAQGMQITLASIRSIEDYILDNRHSIDKLRYGTDVLIRVLANIVKSEAQRRSGGPVAARHRSNPALAFKIPVQRITGRYYAGWTLRRVRNAHWMVYNEAYEAWLIETGLYQRVRRPILKLSVIAMLRFIQSTRTADSFVDWVLAPRRNTKGQFRSFENRVRAFKLGNPPPVVSHAFGFAHPRSNRGSRNPNIAGPTGRLPR